MYHYKLKDIRVVDGDTIDCLIDLGCSIFIRRTMRLYGINAPEMHGSTLQAATITTNRLKQLIMSTTTVYGKTILDKSDKYGRLLIVLYPSDDINQKSFNDILLEEKLCVSYEV